MSRIKFDPVVTAYFASMGKLFRITHVTTTVHEANAIMEKDDRIAVIGDFALADAMGGNARLTILAEKHAAVDGDVAEKSLERCRPYERKRILARWCADCAYPNAEDGTCSRRCRS